MFCVELISLAVTNDDKQTNGQTESGFTLKSECCSKEMSDCMFFKNSSAWSASDLKCIYSIMTSIIQDK